MTWPNRALLTTADGRPLAQALVEAQARSKRRAFWLVAPLLASSSC
jgi:putative spermidine/putrescine transport system permease protein